MLTDFFRLREHGSTVKTEVIAGITTFMTMAYIIATMFPEFFIASPVCR